MRFTFLGSGGAFTDYRLNYHNNALVETGEGPVMIDCGTTATQSLRELGIAPTAVHAVLFTHLHADHASPEQLIWQRFYGLGELPPPFRKTRLVGPRNLLQPLGSSLRPFMDAFTDEAGRISRGGVEHLVEPVETEDIEIGGVRFEFFRVPHVTDFKSLDKPAYGLRISDGRTRVLWSGDTTFAQDWVKDGAADASVDRIFHECSFSPLFEGTVHTHIEQLLTLPDDVQSKITLMHHTRVPEGADLGHLRGAADRHQVIEI